MLDADGFELTYDDLSLSNTRIDGRYYENCVFRRCSFENVVFTDCRFLDCTFEGCDLVNVRLPGCTVADTTFTNGRAMGVDWGETLPITLRVTFTGVRMDYSHFAGLPLKRTVFTDCSMREVVFERADLSHTRFVECDLRGAVLAESDLRSARFERCTGVLFDPRTCRLGDTHVGADTAIGLLAVQGVLCPELGTS